MDPSNVASHSASQTSNASNPPLPGAIMLTLPLTGAAAPAFNYAIALQQYQFQQSLVNQQLVAQQQAVAHAVSIKAAAERAAARAAEISMLLNGENKVVLRSEDLVAEREKSGLKSRSRSASPPQSSKPNTVSPIRYRNSRRELEEHSPRDRSGYGSRRTSSSYSRYNDLRGYSRASYRRGEDYSGGRSSYNRNSNTSWSRRRSPLSRSRYRHGDSRSPRRRDGSRSPRRHVGSRLPRYHRNRSPSPMSRHRTSSRISTRHSISKSPINGGSSSSSLHARKGSPRKATARRSLSSSEDSPIHNTANLLLKENKGADAINISENNISSNLNARWQERDAKPSRGDLVSGRSNSDHFGKMNCQEPALKKSVSREFASASMYRSDSDNSQGRSVQRGLGSRDCENDSEASAPPRYTDHINLPTEMLNRCSTNRNDGDFENRNGDFSMSNGKGKKVRESATEKGIEGGHRKPSRINEPSSSPEPENNLSDQGQRNYSDKREEKMHVNKEFNMHEQDLPWKVISGSEEDSANIPGECAIYPLPEGPESKIMKEVDFSSPTTVPDGDAKIDGNLSTSPKVHKHREKRHKLRSISRDRRTKHRKSQHKMHRDESEEEDADKKRESHEKRKVKKREKKGRERYNKSHDERKRKRKHHDVPSSSSPDDLSSLPGDEQNARKTSTSSRKKMSSPAAPPLGQTSNEHNARSLVDSRDTN